MAGAHINQINLNTSREGDDIDEDVDTTRVSPEVWDFEQTEVDDTVPYFENVPQSTPLKGLQTPTIDLVSPIKTSHGDGKLDRQMSLSEGDLSKSIGSLNISDQEESRMCWVRFVRHKSELFDEFTSLIAQLENESGQKLGILRSDRGGEYMSNRMSNFLKKRGVKRQLAVTDAHQQNGVSERMNRTIMDHVRSMLSESGLPHKALTEAVNWAVYVRNRCPTSSLPLNVTPFEAWYGYKPSVSHFRVFGCAAYAHVPLKQRSKLDPKTEDCIFVGYDEQSKE